MSNVFELCSREENGAFLIDDLVLKQLLTVSSLKRCASVFPIQASVRSVRSVKRGKAGTYSIDGLRRVLCVNEEQMDFIKLFDESAFFGEICVAGLDSRHYIYTPSIILGPSNEHNDTMLGMSGRYRLRAPEFQRIPAGVDLFTISEAYEATGQTFCTRDFIARAGLMKIRGFSAWDIQERSELLI